MELKSNIKSELLNFEVKITGLVQGIGFRPFIYRQAKYLGIKGYIINQTDGVYIRLQATQENLQLFLDNIRLNAPPAATIDNIAVEKTTFQSFQNFSILSSQTQSNGVTEVSPDIAVCSDCLREMNDSGPRKDYPFINCTNCGPRFTIIRNLPYDRIQTTMESFIMCPPCSDEYHNIDNRRFHAQPTACPNCGPNYSMVMDNTSITHLDTLLTTTASLLEKDEVIAIKGLGGFNLICDAFQENAVSQIRHIKNRDSKPFAVMCRDLEVVKQIACLHQTEVESITSWRRPIVLLQSKNIVASGVSNGLKQVGVMLPYLPFHYLLFEKVSTTCMVYTSGNISDEPIVMDNEQAIKLFSTLTRAVIVHNRDIFNRCDDSVVMVANQTETIIRRSRGYVPTPIKVTLRTEGIFGAGAELTNSFAIGKGNQVMFSQHIGDLKNAETLDFYKETFTRFSQLFRFSPSVVACDMHPHYLSTVFAMELSEKLDIPLIKVQHHHAHIASCMAEHNLDEEVIGISLDGVGLGLDEKIWGGEIYTANLATFHRHYHFEYIPISGGNELAYEPWRSALAYIIHYFGNDIPDIPLIKNLKPNQYINYLLMLKKGINTWQYSSSGRLFDAVAAITGVCSKAGFHAEAPMRLESIADSAYFGCYSYQIIGDQISFREMFREIIKDVQAGKSATVISSKFHQTIVRLLVECAEHIRTETGLNKVVLSGGTFQNKWILERIVPEFVKANMDVYVPARAPANDGGIALGQVIIAAKILDR